MIFLLVLLFLFLFRSRLKIWIIQLIQRLTPRNSACDFPAQRSENLNLLASPSSFSYDVFLSFRGEDTRLGFTGNLYKALHDKGIHTFIDDVELQRGNIITPSLLKAIEESKIAIVVLSENYASSSFCLDELVHILHCSSNNKDSLVLPVFYEVDPSDVRHLRGKFGEALAKHQKKGRINVETLYQWKIALHQVANLSGFHFKHGAEYEYKFIESIVRQVSNKINRVPLHVAAYPVGLESQVLQVKSLLYDGLDGVCMVGIHGIGGMGKTTLARAVCNSVVHQFEGFCFLEDVRKKDLINLQKIVLFEIIGKNDIQLTSVNQGISILKHRLRQKKVLLVLDDVDESEQLQAIVGEPGWFGIGSKVIITTRDQHLLNSHGVQKRYEVKELNEEDALKLLSWKAFKSDKVDPSYEDILKRVVTYASGLPLALEVISSNLFGKRREEWESALYQYERIPNKKIHDILKVSFDSLEECQQKHFLDMCLFNGCHLTYVNEILHAYHGVRPEYSIGVFIEKSLMKIDNRGYLILHDLIEDMGKEIVRKESPEEPSKHSRLWFHEDIVRVLEQNMGTRSTQIIVLDPIKVEVEIDWDGEAFKEMKNLKILIIRGVCFSKGPKHLPNCLRVLGWQGYPSPSLPYDFNPKNLDILILSQSCLTSLELHNIVSKKNFMILTILNFNMCQHITEIPDVSGLLNLVSLLFDGCYNLIKIHESVGFLDKLRNLEFSHCTKLRTFPPIKLPSLEYLGLAHCLSLERFPEILGKMECIRQIKFMGTCMNELPFSIHRLTWLQILRVSCIGRFNFPSSIAMLAELETLTIGQYTRKDSGSDKASSMLSSKMNDIEFSPEFLTCLANLKSLTLKGDYVTVIPASIKECHLLTELCLMDCKLLREIEGIPPNLRTLWVTGCISLKVLDLSLLPPGTNECHFLRTLYVTDCENLQQIIGIPSNLKSLVATNCKSLSSIWMLLNQELHEQLTPYMWLHLHSISFKFPPRSLCYLIGLQTNFYDIKLIINRDEVLGKEMGTISLLANTFNSIHHEADDVFLKNRWNDFKYSIELLHNPLKVPPIVQIRLHIVKQESCMEDIQFTNPHNLEVFNWWH